MQRADYQNAGLGGGEGERDCFQVAHLADQYDIGVLTQRGFETGGKRDRVARYLALGNDAPLVVVHEFDWFLDRHDMLGKVLIDKINKRGLRGCFTRARWACDENESAPQIGKFFDHHGNPQLLQTGDLRRNQPKSCGITMRLLKVIGAKPRLLVHLVGKIEITVLLEILPVLRAASFAQHANGFLVRNGLISDGHDIAMRAYFRRLALADMQIGCALPGDDLQKLIDISHF